MTSLRTQAGAFALALAAAAFLLPPAAPAKAEMKPYIGGDIGVLNLSFDDDVSKERNDDSATTFGVHVGARLNQNFGVELGYTRGSGFKKTFSLAERETDASDSFEAPAGTSGTNKGSLSGFNLDGLFYFPIGSGNIEGIATAGLARWEYEIKTEYSKPLTAKTGNETLSSVTFKDTDTFVRFGGGAQFNLSDQFSVRGLLRYYPISGFYEDIVDSAWDATIGFNVSF